MSNKNDIYKIIAIIGTSIVCSYILHKQNERRKLERIREEEMINKHMEDLMRDFIL